MVLSLWRKDRNRIDSYRVSTVDVPESYIAAVKEVREYSSGVTPCIVMKNNGILYYQVSSFSLERWTIIFLLNYSPSSRKSPFSSKWLYLRLSSVFIKPNKNGRGDRVALTLRQAIGVVGSAGERRKTWR